MIRVHQCSTVIININYAIRVLLHKLVNDRVIECRIIIINYEIRSKTKINHNKYKYL